MPGKKDAAWWRDYRARKALEQQQSKGLQDPVVERVDIDQSTQDVTMYDAAGSLVRTVTYAERATATPQAQQAATVALRKLPYLAAPDDDCATCGHDRQTTHPMGGKCGYGCLCRRFRPAGTELLPCLLCGHDEFHGHAATPCDQWAGKHPCGCPSFVDAADPF
jgi:hypothetical protein